jgi:two-component system CheB/CheR fusion protein
MEIRWGAGELDGILEQAKSASGVDFVRYRLSTMQRRTELRMAMCECSTATSYLARIRELPEEMDALVDALLVKTTWMYREPRTFDLLRQRALPDLFARRAAEGAKAIVAWVPACSSGEEAFSLAMCFEEARRNAATKLDFQVFASDVDSYALATANAATYPEASFTELPRDFADRHLERFTQNHQTFARISPALKSRVVFAHHDALRSSRVAPTEAGVASFDLVSCRNLLVYLQPAAQDERVTRLLKTCSRGSLLVIGDSESFRASNDASALVPIEPKIPVFELP